MKAHAYSLLRTICSNAVTEDIITVSPCRIRGAGQTKRAVIIRPATMDELAIIHDHMPERLRMAVLISSWCALRFGEMTELRRSDVDVKRGILHVRRGVVRVNGITIVGETKSSAGTRDVVVPPHLKKALSEHISKYAEPGRNGLVFPATRGGHMTQSSLAWHYNKADGWSPRPSVARLTSFRCGASGASGCDPG